MLLTLLKFRQAILAGVLVSALAFGLHRLDLYRMDALHREALASQASKLEKQCEADKVLTSEVSNGYQTRLASLADQLARARRVRHTCVPVAPVTPGGRDAAPGIEQPVRPDVGVTADALLDYAAEAERYRLQLLSCQEFITRSVENR